MRLRPWIVLAGAAVFAAIGILAKGDRATSQSVKRAFVNAQIAANSPTGAAAGGINWQAAVAAQRRGLGNRVVANAPGLDPAAIDRTALPILLPSDASLLQSAKIYSFGDQYTVAAVIAGAHVALTGQTAMVPLKPVSPLAVAPEGAEGLTVQSTIDGQLLSFSRYGVLYTVELRCDSPSDPRCHSQALVRALQAKTTVVVLGKAARLAAGMGG
jgi:hypothetical protein